MGLGARVACEHTDSTDASALVIFSGKSAYKQLSTASSWAPALSTTAWSVGSLTSQDHFALITGCKLSAKQVST
eukprot:395139-Amphidinium_carterae.1